MLLSIFLADIPCQKHHLIVADHLGLTIMRSSHARLNGIGALNAVKRSGDLLELLETLDIVLNILTSCTGLAAEMRPPPGRALR